MHKYIAGILLSILLLSNTQLYQLHNIPAFIHHYADHSRQEGLDLIAFIKKHYGHHNHSNENSEHQKLPFKNLHEMSMGLLFISFHPGSTFPIMNDIPVVNDLFSLYSNNYSHTDYNDIWQPPRSI